jgi:hypothetical protein
MDLGDIPALVIDDESDLASINTKNPEKTQERTAINAAITDIAEAVAASPARDVHATPFANFFVDPDDSVETSLRTFIVALDRPPNYMGVEDFTTSTGTAKTKVRPSEFQ